MLALLLMTAGCKPKPEKSDIKPGEPGYVGDSDSATAPPEGDRVGSGYW